MCWSGENDTFTSVETMMKKREQGLCWFNSEFRCPHPCALLCSGCVDLVAFENMKRKGER